MMSKEDFTRLHEEREVLESWRSVSCHVVADLCEACSICGTVRERERLTRCRWCDDVYYCADGFCAHQHRLDVHPAVAFWTW